MNKEYQNYFIYLLFRKGFFFASVHYFKFLFRILFTRIIKIRYIFYPVEIKKLVKLINNSKKTKLQKESFSLPNKIPPGPKSLKLTNIDLKFDDYPNWKETFDDPENILSLNRWNWLLTSITNNDCSVTSRWGTCMIKSYINDMSILPKGIRSESYTVAERISNTCIFFRSLEKNWISIPRELYKSLDKMAYYLINNLEFHSGDLTGNHIVNNARALMLYGYSTNNNKFVVLGKEILGQMLPKLIDQGGFLREGSSHYQFLFSRWMLELRIVGEENYDFQLLGILNSVLFKLIEGCKFFIITNKENSKKSIPLIGDVSPDCDPYWLLDMPFSAPALLNEKQKAMHISKGWSELFYDWKCNIKYNWNKRTQLILSNSWTRVEFEDWVAIFHHETPIKESIASHSHYDFGSFVLYHKGKEIIIDTGRINYIRNDTSNLYVSQKFHSTISLNGLPVVMRRGDRFFPPHYIESNFKKTLLNDKRKITFSIENSGLSRITTKEILHTRFFMFYKNSIKIVDKIVGNGSYKMECYFQLPLVNYKNFIKKDDKKNNTYSIKDLGIKIELEENTYDISSNVYQGSINPKLGWRSNCYGNEDMSTNIKYYGKIILPFEASYEISLSN